MAISIELATSDVPQRAVDTATPALPKARAARGIGPAPTVENNFLSCMGRHLDEVVEEGEEDTE